MVNYKRKTVKLKKSEQINNLIKGGFTSKINDLNKLSQQKIKALDDFLFKKISQY